MRVTFLLFARSLRGVDRGYHQEVRFLLTAMPAIG